MHPQSLSKFLSITGLPLSVNISPYPKQNPNNSLDLTHLIPYGESSLSFHLPSQIPHVLSIFNFAPDAKPNSLQIEKVNEIEFSLVTTKVVSSA